MDTIQRSVVLYGRMKVKLVKAALAVRFLTTCRKQQVIPNFIRLKTNVKSKSSKIGLKCGQMAWLRCEISAKLAQIRHIEEDLYFEHLKIISFHCKNNLLHQRFWIVYEQNLRQKVSHMCKKIRKRHERKLKRLIDTQRPKNRLTPQNIPNFVVNLSTKSLSTEESELLNKGLKFAPKPAFAPLEEIIVDIESGIQYRTYSEKERIRSDIKNCLMKLKKSSRITSSLNNDVSLQLLKEKDVIYVKAD